MRLTYNSIPMTVLHTPVPPSREVVKSPDDSTYLFTRWKIRVIAQLNPQHLSFSRGDPWTEPPVPTPGNAAATSDRALRHRLMQPRGVLILEDDSQPPIVILRAPNEGQVTDCQNGPMPTFFHIRSFMGKTWVVEFAIEACVNENENRPVLLSHRWRITHDVDQDFLSTTVHEGECQFDTARLQELGHFPDMYRGALFPYIPKGFRREAPQVVITEEGSRLLYRVVDRQTPGLNQNLTNTVDQSGPTIATRIEAFQRCGWARGSPSQNAAIANGLWNTYSNGLPSLLSGAQNVAGGGGPFAIAGLGVGQVQTFNNAFQQSNTPQFHNEVTVRAWGNGTHKRAGLLATCMRICLARLIPSNATPGFYLTGISVSATAELTGKFIELTAVRRSGPEAVGLASIDATMSFANNWNFGWVTNWLTGTDPFLPQGPWSYVWGALCGEDPAGNIETIVAPDVADLTIVSTSPNIRNPAPPNSNGSRGTWVGKLFAAQMMAMDAEKPADPQGSSDLDGTVTDETP
jgi:hypothetical protein